MASRHSGLQRDVLSLYRKLLREAVTKDRQTIIASHGATADSFTTLLLNDHTSTNYVSGEFRRQAAQTKRSDFKRIEHMIRKGEKQIKILRMPGVTVVRGTHRDELK